MYCGHYWYGTEVVAQCGDTEVVAQSGDTEVVAQCGDTGKGVVRDMAPLQLGWWHESSCNFRYELLNARFSG